MSARPSSRVNARWRLKRRLDSRRTMLRLFFVHDDLTTAGEQGVVVAVCHDGVITLAQPWTVFRACGPMSALAARLSLIFHTTAVKIPTMVEM